MHAEQAVPAPEADAADRREGSNYCKTFIKTIR